MGSPALPDGILVDIWTGGGWEDITADALNRDPITITRGIPDEGGVIADPTSCKLSLLNSRSKINGVVGRYSDRNPLSDLYGKIGINTPLRIVAPVADDDFERTVANGWGTAPSGQTWTTVGGDAADFAVAAGEATIDIDTVNSQRLTVLDVDAADVEMVATVGIGVVATGSTIQAELLLRHQDDGTFYEAALVYGTGGTIDLVVAARKGGAVQPLQSVQIMTSYTANTKIRIRAKVSGFIPVIAAKAWDATGDEPLAWQLRVADSASDAMTTPGGIGFRGILGSLNTNPLPVTLTASDMEAVNHRCNGEVSQWPPRWDVSGQDVWMPIEASGLLRRLGATTAVMSPLRRTMPSFVPNSVQPLVTEEPDAYWPLEDGAATERAGSGLPGGTPMRQSGTIQWGAVNTIPGSQPAPDMLRTTGKLVGSVPPPAAPTNEWTVTAVVHATAVTPSYPVLTWRVTGSLYAIYELRIVNDESLELTAYDGAGAAFLLDSSPADGLFDGPASIGVDASESSGDTNYNIFLNGVSIGGAFAAGITTGQLHEIELVARPESDTESVAVCHVSGWHRSGLDSSAHPDIAAAVRGFPGETVSERLARLFREEKLPFVAIGPADEQMGPQRTAAALMTLVDDAVQVGKGLFFELRDEVAAAYLTLPGRYNRPVALALDYTSDGHIAPGLEPLPDDLDVVNILTVTRRDGASATYEKPTGRKSTQNPPQGIGRYPQTVTLDLHTDDQTQPHAAWTVTVATWDEERYSQIPLDIEAAAVNSAASVVEGTKRLDVGDRLTVSNPPAWLPPGDIEQQALSFVESITLERWQITPHTLPNGPYAVGVAGDEATPGAWSQTGPATALVSQLASGATSALVHSDGPVFTTDATELVYSPLGVVLGGEVCPVPSTPQARDTFTRSVSNGWGTSTSGSAWTTTGGNAADYSVNGTEGVITLPTGDLFTRNATLPEVYTDVDMRFTVQLAQLATGDEIRAYALLRCTGVDSCYRVEMQFEVPGHIDVNLQSEVSGSVTTLATASQVAAYSADSDVFVHAQMHGSRLRVKIWTGDADLPPTEWTVEAVGATFSSGQIGIRAQLSGGNTNVNPVVRFDNLWVGEAGIKSALLDTFTRTETSGWNSPDIGPAWTVVDGTATDITVSGGVGQHSMSAAGAELEVALDVAWPDLDIIITDVTWPVTPTGAGNPAQRLKARFVDVDNFVEIGVFRITSDTITTRLRQEIAGVETGTAFMALSGATSTTTVSVRLQAIGSTLRAKVWPAADPEPDAWRHSLATTLLSGGQVKLRTAAPAGSTNVFPLVATYDDIEVTNPQTIELTRTVAKTHAAGSIVQVHRPLVAAL